MKGILPFLIVALIPAAEARLLDTEQQMDRRHGRPALRFDNQGEDGVRHLEETLHRPGALHVNAWYGTPGQYARAWLPGRPIVADLAGRVMRERVTTFDGQLDAAFVAEFFSGYGTTWGRREGNTWVEVDIVSYFTCLANPQPGCIVYSELVSSDGKYRAYLGATRIEIEFRDIVRRR
jgi:hypothetical protein